MVNVCEHVLYKLRNAQVLKYPFPHFFATDVFPLKFYEGLLAQLPEDEVDYKSMGGTYASRFFADNQLKGVEFMADGYFGRSVIKIFPDEMKKLPNLKEFTARTEIRLIRDRNGYQIGPHTDAPWKLISLLFYLPENDAQPHIGTSIYVPHDHRAVCEGGPHYGYEGFHVAATMPFIPNSCFGFWKTNNSWHGVEPIDEDVQRDVLLYNIYDDSRRGDNGTDKQDSRT